MNTEGPDYERAAAVLVRIGMRMVTKGKKESEKREDHEAHGDGEA